MTNKTISSVQADGFENFNLGDTIDKIGDTLGKIGGVSTNVSESIKSVQTGTQQPTQTTTTNDNVPVNNKKSKILVYSLVGVGLITVGGLIYFIAKK